MSYTATEYTRSQMDGRLYRVGWHKFDTQRQAEHWARRRLSAPMMAPHWIEVKHGRRVFSRYAGDGNGNYKLTR